MTELFSDAFMPHGHCYFWNRTILGLHVGSDAVIALSYLSIPIVIAWFTRHRRDLAFPWVLRLFGAFILACGLTHAASIVTTWKPWYGAEGLLKAVTAAISLVTAVVLWPLLPKALALPSPAELAAEVEERRRAEAKARRLAETLESRVEERTRELEQSNADLQRFAYFASHDLKEPLRMVASFTQLTAEKLEDSLDEETSSYMGFALDGVRRMDRLIDDLLRYAKLSRLDVPPHRCPLDEALDQALEDLADRVRESGAEIVRSPLPIVRGSLALLATVFENLVSNAIKYSGEAAPRVEITARREEARWAITVRDEGTGFEPRQAERIFETFTRLHGSDVEGTGIGLALCQRVINLHGGTIAADSAPGEGSAFTFTLPALEEEEGDA